MLKATLSFSFILLVLNGCTPRQQYVHQYNFGDYTPGFAISDERPETEKTAEILSVNVMSDYYGIFRIGDTQMIPDRIKYLTNRLDTKLNNKLAGKTVLLNHFEIHNNLQKILKKGVTYGAFGLAGIVASGLTNNPDALIDINLALAVDSKQYGVHLVRGYKLPSGQGASAELVANEIYAAIDESVDRIASELIKAL